MGMDAAWASRARRRVVQGAQLCAVRSSLLLAAPFSFQRDGDSEQVQGFSLDDPGAHVLL